MVATAVSGLSLLYAAMSVPRTILMLTVLLGLGAYVYFVELPKARQDAEKPTILTFEKEAVDTLTLTYPEREISLQQTAAGEWNLTAPIQVKADDTTVNNMLTALGDEEVTRSLTPQEPTDLALYGLAQPPVVVRLVLQDGTALPKMSIGKDTPVGFSVYVQKEGDPRLHLTRQAFRLGLTKGVKELRDKTVLPFERDRVTQLAIDTSETSIVLAKTEAGWTFERPAPYAVDASAIQTYLSTLEGIRAEDFVEQPSLDLSAFGLDPAQLIVSLRLGEDATRTLAVGDEKSADAGTTQRYLKRDDGETLYLARAGLLKDLSKSVADFRDKAVVSIPEGKISQVVVMRQGGAGFTLSRGEENVWEIDRTSEGTLKTATLGQFVADLRELRGFEIAVDNPEDLSLYGLADPAVTLVATDETGEKLATVFLGQTTQEETEKHFAMPAGGETVFTLRDYVFSRFDKNPEDFWEKPEPEEQGEEPLPVSGPDTAEESPLKEESLE